MLSLSNSSYRYLGSDDEIISDINFDVPARAFCAIVGQSGVGKTTLLNLLAGYTVPTGGTIEFQGRPVDGPDPARIPIYQEDGLWPWFTAAENVLLHPLLNGGRRVFETRMAEANAWLGRVGLSEVDGRKYPKELSAGMRKRVEIARALVAEPQVLLADEPLSSLDTVVRQGLHELILNLWADRSLTVVFTSHDLSEVLYLGTMVVVLTGNQPSTVAAVLANPFHGDVDAARTKPAEYFEFRDRIRAGMKSASAP